MQSEQEPNSTLVDLSDLTDYIDGSSFKSYPSSLCPTTLATSTDTHLILNGFPTSLLQDNLSLSSDSHSSYQHSKDSRHISTSTISNENNSVVIKKLVLEYNKNHFSSGQRVHLISWITPSLLCIGFQSGLLLCYDINGKEIFSFSSASQSCIQKILVFYPFSHQNNLSSVAYLFILYEDSLIVCLPLSDAINGRFSKAYGFELKGMTYTYDMIIYSQPYVWKDEWEDLEDPMNPFGSHASGGLGHANNGLVTTNTGNSSSGGTNWMGLRFFVVGNNSSIAIYDVDMNKIKMSFEVEGRDRTSSSGGGSISRSLFSFVSNTISGGNNANNQINHSVWSRTTRVTSLVNIYKFSDPKRSIIKAVMDPFYTLVALSDSLGRVTLFDLESHNIIRLWKGLRNAGLSWIIDNTTSNNESRLKLLIHAPMLGLASLYQMKNGPCLRIIPLGFEIKLIPKFIYNEDDSFIHTGLFLKVDQNKIQILPIQNVQQQEDELNLIISMMEKNDLDLNNEGEHTDFLNKIQKVMSIGMLKKKNDFQVEELTNLLKYHQFSFIKNDLVSSNNIQKLLVIPAFSELKNSFASLLQSEAKILLFLAIQNVLLMFKYITYLELVELVGCENSKEVSLNIFTNEENLNFETPVIFTSNIHFSSDFHHLLLILLESKIKSESINSIIDGKIKEEIDLRKKLLDIYLNFSRAYKSTNDSISTLLDFPFARTMSLANSALNSGTNSPSAVGGSQASTLREEISTICRQSTPRSEALCWVMRIIKRYDKMVYTQKLNNGLTSFPSTQMRTTHSNKLSVNKPENITKAISPLSPGDRKTLSKVSTPNVYSMTPSMNVSAPVTPLTQLNGLNSTDIIPLDSTSFSAFRLFFTTVLNKKKETSIEINFNSIEQIFLERVNKKSTDLSEIMSNNFYTILSNLLLHSSNKSKYTYNTLFEIHPKVGYEFLTFIFNVLLGDFSCLHQYRTCLKSISPYYTKPISLRSILPCYLHYLFHLPLDHLAGFILVKSSSTSPLERYIKEHLLNFQSIISSYNLYLRKEMEKIVQKVEKDTINEEKSEEISEYDPSFDEIKVIRKDVYNQIKNSKDMEPPYDFIPSFDQYISYLLAPSYILIQLTTKLEPAMAFIALILETLQNVHDQIERRSYGQDILKETLNQWKILMRQLRIVLLLKSRSYRNHDVMFPCSIPNLDEWCHINKMKDIQDEGQIYSMDSKVKTNINDTTGSNFVPNYSISQILSGELNIYQILACDTLEFSQKADQACDHEERCLKVYLKKVEQNDQQDGQVQNIGSSVPNSPINLYSAPVDENQSREVLLAWGEVADKRWKDILSVAINEDTIVDSSFKSSTAAQQSNNMVKRRRKPLLLFFPQHNTKVWLCIYRCLSLATRWAVQIENIELLAMVCEHLYNLPVEWRGVVAAWIFRTRVLPVIQVLLIMEEEDHGLDSTIISKLLPSQLLILMNDLPSLRSFVRLSVELLNYCLEMSSNSTFNTTKNHSEYSSLLKIPPNVLMNFPNIDFVSESTMLGGNYNNDYNDSVWPNINIRSFSNFYKCFFLIDENSQETEPEKKSDLEDSSTTNNSTKETTNSAPSTSNSTTIIWNVHEFLRYQITILWILQLRFQFGMRGVKPSQLIGPSIKDIYLPLLKGWTLTSEIDQCKASKYWLTIDWTQIKWSAVSSTLTDELFTRIQFLDQCCSKMIANDSQIVVHTVARIWGIEIDMVRLLQLLTQIENHEQLSKEKNQLFDFHFDDLYYLFNDPSLILDTLLNFARVKLGSYLSQIELIPSYGMFIASMDADALYWAKQSLNTYYILNNPIQNSPSKQQSIQLDISSLRKLLLDIQITLTSLISSSSHMTSTNPFTSNIYNSTNIEVQKSNSIMYSNFRKVLGTSHPLLNAPRYDSWNERLSRCSILISLCQSMMPLSLKKKANT